ncbi:MAG: HEAT repeat domain-containing protein [Armatimonadota bacterium]|jgi:hypothetical protein
MRTRIRAALLLIILWGSTGGIHAQTTSVDEDLIARLRSDNLQTRAAAIPVAVPELLKRVWADDMSWHHGSLQVLREAVWRATGDVYADDRRPLAAALVKAAADRSLSVAARCEALELASLVASSESVPLLAELLTDPDVGESARVCLVRIAPRASGAAGALRSALASASPERQVALINGLATARASFAEQAVRSWLNSPSAEVRMAVLRALGSIGGAQSLDALWQAAEKGAQTERMAALDSILRIAESLPAEQARPVYEKVYTGSRDSVEKCAGLAGITRVRQAAAVPLLTQSLLAKEPDVRGLAALALAEMPGSSVSVRLAERLPVAPLEQQVAIVSVLARRYDAPSALALFRAAASERTELRAAAYQALAGNRNASRQEVARVLAERLPAAQAPAERSAILSAVVSVAHPSLLAPLMNEWEAGRGNTEVLRALLAVADSCTAAGREEDAAKVYLLVAENATDRSLLRMAAASLKDAALRQDFASRAGFVMHWWVLGPLKGRDKWSGQDAFPVDSPVDLSTKVTVDGEEFAWKPAAVGDPLGELDLAAAAGPGEDSACYAYAEIISPSERDAWLRLGSDDGVIVYLNGQKVHEFKGERNYALDEDSVRVTLRRGTNLLLCKVLNAGGGYSVGARFVDLEGRPLRLEQRRP